MISSLRLVSRINHLFRCSGFRSFSCSRIAAEKRHDPLRILFCGSDNFSIASLQALNGALLSETPLSIHSIDVVCRPGKRTGRGLKTITHPPIRDVANKLKLPLHEIDTFTGWQPPQGVNLVIAVSFGLLVPPRILGLAKYGGLNVHPSLLPDLRGGAPLQHTLLQQRTHTGITVQTLHPDKFDHGNILAQSPLPGIPVPPDASVKTLEQLLAPLGADLLLETLHAGKFLDPVSPLDNTESQIEEITNGKGLALAPKITSEHLRIDWKNTSNAEMLLRDRVLGNLWDDTTHTAVTGKPGLKRIVYGRWTLGGHNRSYLWKRFGIGAYVGLPIKTLEDGSYKIEVGKPARIMKDDLGVIVDSETRRISTDDFTVDGKGKGKGGLYFAEVLRKKEMAERGPAAPLIESSTHMDQLDRAISLNRE